MDTTVSLVMILYLLGAVNQYTLVMTSAERTHIPSIGFKLFASLLWPVFALIVFLLGTFHWMNRGH